jgi:hypothetical protein
MRIDGDSLASMLYQPKGFAFARLTTDIPAAAESRSADVSIAVNAVFFISSTTSNAGLSHA